MPYNLRKRKVPEQVAPIEVKKRAKTQPKPKPEPKSKKEPKQEAKLEAKQETKHDAKHDTKLEPELEPELESQDDKQVVVEKVQLAFGNDSCGELGLGKIGVSKKNPTSVPIKEPISRVACGPMHTLTLTESGKCYSYGCNDEGALGRVTEGDETLESTPTVVPLNNKVVKITAGDSHSAVLTDKHEVFVWGNFRDEHGSIGLTPECEGQASFKPIQIMSDIKFKDIASGSNHMLLLDHDGIVYSFGVGAQGQLGRLKPEEVASGEGEEPKPVTAENRKSFLTPQKVSLKDVDPQRPFVCDAIYAGNFSSFATNTDKKKNRVAGWGLNNYSQLGYKGRKGQLVQHYPRRSTFTCSTSIVNIACGQHHTLFLTRTGRVHAAGRHQYGMLGLGKVDKEVCPAKSISDLDPIVDISAGINTSFAVSDTGTLYSWGMGGLNLGLGSEDDLLNPSAVESLAGKKVISVSAGGSFTSVVVAA